MFYKGFFSKLHVTDYFLDFSAKNNLKIPQKLSLEKSVYTCTGQILWFSFLDIFYHFSVRQRLIGA